MSLLDNDNEIVEQFEKSTIFLLHKWALLPIQNIGMQIIDEKPSPRTMIDGFVYVSRYEDMFYIGTRADGFIKISLSQYQEFANMRLAKLMKDYFVYPDEQGNVEWIEVV